MPPISNVPLPGSTEAVASGCVCHKAPFLAVELDTFIVSGICRLHGRPAWEAAERDRRFQAVCAEADIRAARCICKPVGRGDKFYVEGCPVHAVDGG